MGSVTRRGTRGRACATLLAAWCGVAVAAPATALQLMTEELPPYSFKSNNRVDGLSIEIITELFKRAGVSFDIRLVPLRRALATVEAEADSCVFPLERSQEREARFAWVSPLLITQSAFYSSTGRDLRVRSLADARDLSVGTYGGSALHEYLVTFNYSALQIAREELLNARKLQAGRIDLWATDTISGEYFARRAGIADLREQLVFMTTLRGIACNPSISPAILRSLRHELKKMHLEGRVTHIMNSYRFDR